MGNEITVSINGRDAIPVRAIPWVTARTLSPDELAKQLARQVHPALGKLQNTFAYRLTSGTPEKILPKQWDDIIAQLEALEVGIREQHGDKKGYAEWLDKSVLKLPAGVFVWFDEFQADRPFGFKVRGWERDEDLVMFPMWSREHRKEVFEGFEGCSEAIPTGKANTDSGAPKAAPTESTPKAERSESRVVETKTHRLGNTRRHALTAIIEMAKKSAAESTDYLSVWAELVRLAESPSRPAPLLGYTELDGVKYVHEKAANGSKFFTKDALRSMMGRSGTVQ